MGAELGAAVLDHIDLALSESRNAALTDVLLELRSVIALEIDMALWWADLADA